MKVKQNEVQVKAGDEGTVEAIFSTFDVIDSDGDVTRPGAFDEGAKVRISAYNHASWGPGFLPVGKGSIRTTENEAIFSGDFFMSTQAGKETFLTIKEMGELQEWSYGYDVLESEFGQFDGEDVQFLNRLKVHEVSPVILGAGVGTQTLTAKSAKGLRFTEHLGLVLTEVEQVKSRASDVLTLRSEQGKSLGAESLALITRLKSSLTDLDELVEKAAAESEQHEDADANEAALREAARAELRRNL